MIDYALDNASLDEPLVLPTTPGETLMRLCQIRGALPPAHAAFAPAIEAARTALMQALESGAQEGGHESIAAKFTAAQTLMIQLYNAVQGDDTARRVLGFPTPEQIADPCFIVAPDPKTVLTTFTLHGKQVLTSLAFDRALGATAYWLHIVRYWTENGKTQRTEDPSQQSPAPLFARLKLPVGPQILRLRSRNPSASAISEEFQIEVPAL
jgi:hypothetical protein